jgi:hypothetical protein
VIFDHFVAGFKARFPHHPITIREVDATAIFPGGNPEIGAIEVQDDLNELTIFAGSITHGHFGCYDQSMSREEQERKTAQDVLDFLADVFANRIEFYRGKHGGGGWRPAGTGPEPSFTWSATGKS